MKLLVINPNTTESMTAAIEAAAKAVAAPGTAVHAVTSAIGPASIEGFYDEAFAIPGVIAALRDAPDSDAAVIACFDDTGLDAARSFAVCPVVGICEAGLIIAGQVSKRIGVVTTLSRSIVPLEELVRKYGYAKHARVYACDVAVLDIERPGSNARAKIETEITRALADGTDSILLGCAGMTRRRNCRRPSAFRSLTASLPRSNKPKRWPRSGSRPPNAGLTPRRWRKTIAGRWPAFRHPVPSASTINSQALY
jgi:allantoin racemase